MRGQRYNKIHKLTNEQTEKKNAIPPVFFWNADVQGVSRREGYRLSLPSPSLFSHFSLPFSHLSLPFSHLSLPFSIRLPSHFSFSPPAFHTSSTPSFCQYFALIVSGGDVWGVYEVFGKHLISQNTDVQGVSEDFMRWWGVLAYKLFFFCTLDYKSPIPPKKNDICLV